jgi:hypothetical protein
MPLCECLWNRDRPVWDKALSLIATKGRASSWSGWVKMINVLAPGYGESGFRRTIHVLPPAPYLGGDRKLFGAVTPFVVRSLTALRASNGTVFVSYADENSAVKMLTFNTPNGTFYLEKSLYKPNNVPLGFKQVVYIYTEGPYAVALGFEYKRISGRYYWVPFVHKSSDDMVCWFRGNWPYSGVFCQVWGKWSVTITWSINNSGVVSVYRDGVLQRRTRLGQLSTALAWTPDGYMYAASPAGMASDTTRVSAPFAYRWSLSGAYNYTLTLSIEFDRKLLDSWRDGSTTYYLYNVTYRGVMNLTYNGKPAALDAFYSWYYMLTSYTPPPPPPPSGGPPPVEYVGSTCTPTRIKIGEDQIHRELNTDNNGYSVQVANYAIIRETGCGYDYTYRVATSVTTLTANGNIYQVTDDKGNVCGFDRAERDNDGVVRCKENKQSG